MSQQNSCGVDYTKIHPELIRKWDQMFNFLKGNDAKGPLTRENSANIIRNLTSRNEIPADKVELAVKAFQYVWEIVRLGVPSISREKFMDNECRMYLSHTGTKARVLSKLFVQLFHCLDFNSDGYIDMSEFRIYSEATGFKNETSIRKAFQAIDVNGDGKISEDEYVDAYVKYNLDAAVKMEDLPVFSLPQK